MNRHNVATKIAMHREAALSEAGRTMGQTDAPDVLDALARDLAVELPPGQRDQFLLAAGVPLHNARPTDANCQCGSASPLPAMHTDACRFVG